MISVFISYRRDDSQDVTDRIYDYLVERFNKNNIFMDIDAIPLGVDFQEHIAQEVQSCDLVLVIIGRDWLNARDKEGNRRLDNPGDFVRIEIESALTRDIPVIPVLIRDAGMPTKAKLPRSLQSLTHRNAIAVRSGQDFRTDISRLISGIERIEAEANPTLETDRRHTTKKNYNALTNIEKSFITIFTPTRLRKLLGLKTRSFSKSSNHKILIFIATLILSITLISYLLVLLESIKSADSQLDPIINPKTCSTLPHLLNDELDDHLKMSPSKHARQLANEIQDLNILRTVVEILCKSQSK